MRHFEAELWGRPKVNEEGTRLVPWETPERPGRGSRLLLVQLSHGGNNGVNGVHDEADNLEATQETAARDAEGLKRLARSWS